MGGATESEFSELLARLYAGIAADPAPFWCSEARGRPWQDFLEALARWMDATFATIIITAGENRHPATFVTPGGSAEFGEIYARTLFANDPFQGLPDGQVTSYGEFMANLPDAEAPEYRAAMRDSGFDLVLGVDLRFQGKFEARFRISRHNSLPDFTAAERNRLQALVPHLRIAVGLFERLQFAGAEHGVFHSAAQGMGLAVIVLDRAMRIVSSNPLADHILGAGEGLNRRGDHLAFGSAEHHRTLAALLADAGGTGGAASQISSVGSVGSVGSAGSPGPALCAGIRIGFTAPTTFF